MFVSRESNRFINGQETMDSVATSLQEKELFQIVREESTPRSSLYDDLQSAFGSKHDLSHFVWLRDNNIENSIRITSDYIGIASRDRLNNVKRINKFLEFLNRSIHIDQSILICVETMESRRVRILNKYPFPVNYPYYFMDFVLKRCFPKLKFTRKIYFHLTKGRNRVVSFTEMLGRLYSCGFTVQDHIRIGYLTYFIATKVDKPAYDMEPTYGSIVKLRRVGHQGKIIKVYKLRTMHPYSEYIQGYVFDKNNLEEGGKLKDDFRLTSWGKVMRKYWLDEVPMFINLLKGDMKLVGVRPLSQHFFGLYPEDMQNLRIQFKPGLIPPYYADMPNGLDEVIESERRYLLAYQKSPILTDIKYFFKAGQNILFGKARSK